MHRTARDRMRENVLHSAAESRSFRAPFIGSSQTLAEFSGRGVIFQMSWLPGMTWTVSASGGGISSGSSSTLFYSRHTDARARHSCSGDKWLNNIKRYLFIGLFVIGTLFIRLLMGIEGSSINCVQAFGPFAVQSTELLFAVKE